MKIEIDIPTDRVVSILENAWQGAGYWCKRNEEADRVFGHPADRGRYPDLSWASYATRIVLLHGDAGFLEWDGRPGTKPIGHVLTLPKVRRALRDLACDYPNHFGDVMADTSDAETGDVFLQLALLGELRYA